MLVLSRKVGEEIIISDNIRVRIVQIAGGKVRIGITAPDNISVDRQEVHDRRQALASSAVEASPSLLTETVG